MAQISFEFRPYNPDQLTLEIRAAVASVAGVASGKGKIWVIFPEGTPNADMESHRVTLQAVIDAHDPAVLTPEQQIKATAFTTRDQLIGIIADRIAWHVANPVTGANAVEVAGRMQTELIYLMRWIRKDLIT